jgi:FkbM family methyltransferase
MIRKIGLHHIKTFFKPASLAAALRCIAACRQPFRLLYHYITRNPLPASPVGFQFRSPTGDVELKAFSVEDVITLFIVFCRKEYTPREDARVFVDFGSNIGIAAAFFLSRHSENVVYCYEPNPTNIERLRENLRPFEGRYFLEEICVGLEDGTVAFGTESTGVYGAIGADHEGGATMQVPCRNANDIVAQILAEHPTIDFLKLDIEGLEQSVIKALAPDLLENIGQIEAETGEFDHHIPGFSRVQSDAIVKYESMSG